MHVEFKSIARAVMALGLAIGTGAYAQGNQASHYDQDGRPQYRGQGQGYRNGPPPQQQQQYQRQGQGQYHGYGQQAPPQYRGARGPGYAYGYQGQYQRGAGPNHGYYRGGRLPMEYRSRQYVVDDWRGHRLYAPPRGYQWVQTGGDYVLVAIATGIILQLMLSN